MSAVDPLYPLSLFYRKARTPLPAVETVDGADIPDPYRKLLVHNNDMTPTLAGFYRRVIRLNLMLMMRDGDDALLRQVILETDHGIPVEFGAIWIDLNCFDDEPRQLVVECQTPLGTILRDYRIAHTSRPSAFFSIEPDDVMALALNLDEPVRLFGRRNTLINPQSRPIAEVVEILAPHENAG